MRDKNREAATGQFKEALYLISIYNKQNQILQIGPLLYVIHCYIALLKKIKIN